MHTPGKAAWARASPSRLWRRSRAKLPRMPPRAPSKVAPIRTLRAVKVSSMASLQRAVLEQRFRRLGEDGQLAAIGALQGLGVEGGGDRAGRHEPQVQQHHLVEVLRHRLEIV